MSDRILVTGVSRGLGSMLVRALHADGYEVFGLGLAVETSLPSDIRRCMSGYLSCDLSQWVLRPDEMEVGALTLSVKFDGLINNAAVRSFGRFDRWAWADAERLVAVNYLAAMRLAHLLLPGMLERGFGRIVNVASQSGVRASANGALYNSSKAALIAFTESLGRELAKSGKDVTANVICPGAFRPIEAAEGTGAEKMQRIAGRVVGILRSRANARVYYELSARESLRLASIQVVRAFARMRL